MEEQFATVQNNSRRRRIGGLIIATISVTRWHEGHAARFSAANCHDERGGRAYTCATLALGGIYEEAGAAAAGAAAAGAAGAAAAGNRQGKAKNITFPSIAIAITGRRRQQRDREGFRRDIYN